MAIAIQTGVLLCDTEAELLTTAGTEGNKGYATDTQKAYYYRSGSWQAVVEGGSESTGMLKMWAGKASTVPAGYLVCDGSAISRATYAALFTALGTIWGVGDGATTFNLPDGRGGYLKGASAGADAGATGGALTHTHASHTALVHSGTAVADHGAHTHTVTSNVSVADHVFTQPTVSWPAGVPTNANESSHTHAAGAISWPAGVPTISGTTINAFTATINAGGTIAWPAGVPTNSGGTLAWPAGVPTINEPNFTIVGTKCTTSGSGTAMASAFNGTTISSGNTTVANPAQTITWPAGVPTISVQCTIGWPAGVPTISGTTINSVTPTINAAGAIAWPAGVPTGAATGAGSAHTHTVSWPAGVPTNASGSVDTHGVTNAQVTSGNPSATLTHSVTQPSDHTISAHDTVNHEPPYLGMIFIIKT